MTEAIARREPLDSTTLTAVVTDGDCSRLSEDQRRTYYLARCDAAGLDPRTAPFAFVKLNNKLVLYALKSATDQLASNHRVAITILERQTTEGVHCVTVRATAADGRSTEDVGAVAIGALKGEPLANALMKTVTKAKRRAILSLCGLGMTDETELDSAGAVTETKVRAKPITGVIKDSEPPVEPPHDPVTGEILPANPAVAADAMTPQQINIFDGLLNNCNDGFSAQQHKENWLAKHTPEIAVLPKFARDELRKAYEKASTDAKEKKS